VRDTFMCVSPKDSSASAHARLVLNCSCLIFNIAAPLLVACKLWRVGRPLARKTDDRSHDAREQVSRTFATVCGISVFYVLVAAACLPAFFATDTLYVRVADQLFQVVVVSHALTRVAGCL
jgi:hypothetical protein